MTLREQAGAGVTSPFESRGARRCPKQGTRDPIAFSVMASLPQLAFDAEVVLDESVQNLI